MDIEYLKVKYKDTTHPKGFVLPYDEIYFAYIESNLSLSQCSKIFNLSKDRLKYILFKHNIVKDKNAVYDSRKNTYISKYGKSNYPISKDVVSKRTKTLKDNYLKRLKIDIDRLKYLYIDLNYTLKEVAKIFNVSNYIMNTTISKCGFVKSKELELEAKQQYLIRHPEIIEVRQQNKLKGVEKYKKVCLEKYGVDNYAKTQEFKEHCKATCIEKYGVEYSSQNETVKAKKRTNNLEKYGHEYTFAVPELIKKRQNTCLRKYGVSNPSKLPEIHEKQCQTMLERYGQKYYARTEAFKNWIKEHANELIRKRNTTMLKNGTLNESAEELKVFNLLKDKYPDTIHQYMHKGLDPYTCDFYIPSLNLVIDFNGHYTHNYRPYNSDMDKEELKELLSKGRFEIIYTWTILDVRKRELATQNNVNRLEFYTIEEVKNWIIKRGSNNPLLDMTDKN